MAENIVELLTDVADAIREKKGSTEPINAQNFADEIKNLPSGSAPRYTGHADVEGLKAIGWDDDDIAYYQQYGVNWNEEDDEFHKVSEDNKALYGVLTADNIKNYRNRIVYLPKINLDNVSYFVQMFYNCVAMVGMPRLNFSNATNLANLFYNCFSLVSIPPMDTSKVTNMNGMCQGCRALKHIAPIDTSKVTNMGIMFYNCYSLVSIPPMDTSKVTSMSAMFNGCNSLVALPNYDTSAVTDFSNFFMNGAANVLVRHLNFGNATNINNVFRDSSALANVFIEGLPLSLDLSKTPVLTQESLLYIINNESANVEITITLHSYAYTRLAEDAEIVAALAAHPNVSLAK